MHLQYDIMGCESAVDFGRLFGYVQKAAVVLLSIFYQDFESDA